MSATRAAFAVLTAALLATPLGAEEHFVVDLTTNLLTVQRVSSNAIVSLLDASTGEIVYVAFNGVHKIEDTSFFQWDLVAADYLGYGQGFSYIFGFGEENKCYKSWVSISFGGSLYGPSVCVPVTEGCEGGCSPVLIDLDRDGFDLSGPDDYPVGFDMDANGVRQSVGWTAPGAGDAFLARDLNGNGSIDNGKELFGNFTLLANGERAGNGFLALAEVDDPQFGGTGDGVVDRHDAGYWSLLAWIDADHDGMSSPHELRSLADAGVLELSLDWSEESQIDEHGNDLRLWGHGRLRRGRRVISTSTVDVYFVSE